MPRSAATILGLTLVALSIGFNTARYPVVWEMVDPARTSESAQPAATSQAGNSEGLAPPAMPIEVQPTPKAAENETRMPLVPVTPVSSVGTWENQAVGGAGIRRLPPVVPGDAEIANRNPVRSFGESVPVYPSTGIE